MQKKPECGVCLSQIPDISLIRHNQDNYVQVDCKKCGVYSYFNDTITGGFIAALAFKLREGDSTLTRYASAFIRAHNPLTRRQWEDLKEVKKPYVSLRINNLMKHLISKYELNKSKAVGANEEWLSITGSDNGLDFKQLVDYCVDDKNWIESPNIKVTNDGTSITGTLTPTIRAQAEYSSQKQSSQLFIAISFSEEMSDTSDYIKQAITSAEEGKLTPFRIDEKDHVNKIDDEILVEIKNSIALVADFTEHRGGVYFEAGYAMGLGIPIIWTCRKTDMENLHFDIRQYNCIDWEGKDDLMDRLKNRINSLSLLKDRMI